MSQKEHYVEDMQRSVKRLTVSATKEVLLILTEFYAGVTEWSEKNVHHSERVVNSPTGPYVVFKNVTVLCEFCCDGNNVNMMDELLDGLRVSGMGADSIMLGIVYSAMEQAFDKVCCKEGVIERLNEKSRFCELAVMQLDWCLKFVQEKNYMFVLDESICEREKLVSDLLETRDRIHRRLEETEFAIAEMDRELSERFENEMNLSRALEIKDRELQSLRSSFEADKKGSDGWVTGDDGRDGDFCELKNSVDQQFFNIKQKLEDERINITSGMRKMSQDMLNGVDDCEPDLELNVNGNGNSDSRENELKGISSELDPPNYSLRRELSTGFEKMGSDIDILKETLDVAFGMMSNAISLAEVGPTEQQWRWAVEKDAVAVVFRGFVRDVQEDVQRKVGERSKCGSRVLLSENWSQLMDEIAGLHHDLDQLVGRNEDRVQTVTIRDSATSPPVKNVGGSASIAKEMICSKQKVPSDESDVSVDRCENFENTYSEVKEQGHLEEGFQEDQEGQGSLVAAIIRNHESIIRQKSEELNWLKGELLREKGCSAFKKDKGRDAIKKRIDDVISRLDSVIRENAKLDTSCDDSRCFDEKDSISRPLSEEVRQQKEEQEDSDMRTVIMNDISVILHKSLVKDLHYKLHKYDTMNQIRNEVSEVFFRETVKEWNHKIESYNVESHIREAANGGFASKVYLLGRNEASLMEDSPANQFQNFEGLIGQDVQEIVLRETLQEWRTFVVGLNFENLIREEVFHIVFSNAVKDINSTLSLNLTEYKKAMTKSIPQVDLSSNSKKLEELECRVRDDVCMTFLRQMVKEWKKEVDIVNTHNLIRNQESSQKVVLSDNMLQGVQIWQKNDLMQILESLSNCFELKENLILTANLELIERNAHLQLFELEHEKREHQLAHPNGVLIMKDEALGSVINNLEKAMQHIIFGKVRLKELRSCLGLAVGDLTGRCGKMTSFEVHVEDRKDSDILLEKWREVQKIPFDPVFTNIANFSKTIGEFERLAHEKLGYNMSRLKELKHQLDLSVESVTSAKKKELLYKRAFVRRCCNLQKAEIEVDLLADELDDLLILLEKIYIALDHYSPVLQHYFGVR
ncbi:hypothetical protein IFM89_002590 [Coptis chinensis]|uniref:WPP domain-associated protein n=1 Tax=Coptis chinensis TaxID=261450 RepID=A0A835HAE6_9MAGN|nr:hypothetical protein IFM89_002590 [Coptis chinensis]